MRSSYMSYVTIALAITVLLGACSLLETSSSTSNGVTPSIESSDCANTLDEKPLPRLTLSADPGSTTIDLQPGQTHDFRLGTVVCCVLIESVEACVTWSLHPTEGASINADSGAFAVDATTADGSVFTVTANVENGRRVVSIEVYIYTTEGSPLIGTWTEIAQFICDSSEEVVPEENIGELVFEGDGTFSVTWIPLEVRYDYWGMYNFDLDDGTLDLSIKGSNYVPDDVDASGSFSIDEQGYLILTDMWLGSAPQATSKVSCGHRFQRRT